MSRFKFLRKKSEDPIERVEERFNQIVVLVKDLDRKEYNRLKEALDLVWQGWNKVRQVQTPEEREMAEIEHVEKVANYISIKEKEVEK